MAYSKNYNRKSSNSKYSYNKKDNNSSGNGTLKMIAAVLLVFLAIGLIGSVFGHASGSADPDTDETKTPTTSVTDPTVSDPELSSFTYKGETFYFEEGMTWEEFVESDYNTGGFDILVETGDVADNVGDGVCMGTDFCLRDDLIVSGTDYVSD